MKMIIIYTILILLGVQVVSAGKWDYISENKVSVVDNNVAKVTVFPDSIKDHNERVFLNITSKLYQGNVTPVIGTTDGIYPLKVEYGYSVTVPTQQLFCNNVTGCYELNSSYEVFDWFIQDNITNIPFNYGNMTNWYAIDKKNLQKGIGYYWRIQLANFTNKDGKYWIGAYPSIYNISNAINNDRFMVVDPFYYGVNYTATYIAIDSFDNGTGLCGQNSTLWTYTGSGGALTKNYTNFKHGNTSCMVPTSAGSYMQLNLAAVTGNTNITCAIWNFAGRHYHTTGHAGARILANGTASIEIRPTANNGSWTYGSYAAPYAYLNSSFPAVRGVWTRTAIYAQPNKTIQYIINDTNYNFTDGGPNVGDYLFGMISSTPSIGSYMFDDFRCWYGNYTAEPLPQSPVVSYCTSTLSSTGGSGTADWSPLNYVIISSDNQYSNTSMDTTLPIMGTRLLNITNCSFKLNATSFITGIELVIEKKSNYSAQTYDSIALIRKGNGSIYTNGNISATWSSTDTYVSVGHPSDMWGTTWNYTDINDERFGASFSAGTDDANSIIKLSIDNMYIKIYYNTTANPVSPSIVTMFGNAMNWTWITSGNLLRCGSAYNWTWQPNCAFKVPTPSKYNWSWQVYT